MQPEWVALAHILGSRGNKGEVAARLETSHDDRFDGIESVWLVRGDEPGRSVAVENAWMHKGNLILKLAGVDSISEADKLRGYDVCLPFAERRPLPEGEYYLSDLVGCVATDEQTGQEIGVVRNWQEYQGSAPLLEVVSGNGEEVLVPAIPQFYAHVDVAAKRLVLRLPEGLLDINRA